MTIDPILLAAILSLINGGIITALVQALKKWLKIEGGWKATALAAVLSIGGTVYVLLGSHLLTVPTAILYALVVFGETTGLYHLTAGKPTPTPTPPAGIRG